MTAGVGRPRRLPVSFFARDATVVAPELLHKLLRVGSGAGVIDARIVEVEAYTRDDPASHSWRGETARNAVMFGPPGRLYVYFVYGMHHCVNIVTGARGDGQAVLVRAAVIDGVDPRRSNGPGKLTVALGRRPHVRRCPGRRARRWRAGADGDGHPAHRDHEGGRLAASMGGPVAGAGCGAGRPLAAWSRPCRGVRSPAGQPTQRTPAPWYPTWARSSSTGAPSPRHVVRRRSACSLVAGSMRSQWSGAEPVARSPAAARAERTASLVVGGQVLPDDRVEHDRRRAVVEAAGPGAWPTTRRRRPRRRGPGRRERSRSRASSRSEPFELVGPHERQHRQAPVVGGHVDRRHVDRRTLDHPDVGVAGAVRGARTTRDRTAGASRGRRSSSRRWRTRTRSQCDSSPADPPSSRVRSGRPVRSAMAEKPAASTAARPTSLVCTLRCRPRTNSPRWVATAERKTSVMSPPCHDPPHDGYERREFGSAAGECEPVGGRQVAQRHGVVHGLVAHPFEQFGRDATGQVVAGEPA